MAASISLTNQESVLRNTLVETRRSLFTENATFHPDCRTEYTIVIYKHHQRKIWQKQSKILHAEQTVS